MAPERRNVLAPPAGFDRPNGPNALWLLVVAAGLVLAAMDAHGRSRTRLAGLQRT
jgi:hypothetical protein